MKTPLIAVFCTLLCCAGISQAEPQQRELVYVWWGSVYPNGVLGYPSGFKVSATGVTRDLALAALADSARAAKANGAIWTQFTILPNNQIHIEAFLIRFPDPSRLDRTHTFVLP